MSSIEANIDQQEFLFELIKKAQANLKKCPKVRLTAGYVDTRIRCIEEYWKDFRTGHHELFKRTNKEQRAILPYFIEDLHEQCEDLFSSLKGDLTDLYQLLTFKPLPDAQSSPFRQQNDTLQSERYSEDLQLPKLNLPTYSGAYDEWQSFEDSFISTIHLHPRLNDVKKLQYLKSCLVGEASNTIKHFQVTENNYKLAWDCLKNRYCHKRLLVNTILKRLFTLKKITSQSSVQLKALIDNTKECLTSLKAIDINTDSWDQVIIFLTVQKLDQESHKEWETYVSGEHFDDLPTFLNFTTFLESRIRTLELISPTPVTKQVQKDRSHVAVAAAASAPPTCKACNEDHFICYCKEFGKWSVEKRLEFVKEQRLCYNCLATGHSVFFCRQKTTCRICGKRHHSLLHSQYKSRDGELENKDDTTTSMHANADKQDEDDKEEVSLASHFISQHHRALLATALIPVRNESGQVTLLRALVDPGSQATFVSERATQMLRLNKIPVRGTVTGVGSTKTSVSHVVRLEVLSRYDENFKLPVKAYVLTTQLTTRLPCREIKPMSWSHLNGLNLADPKYFTPGKIDMLLGIDVYTEIIKNKLIKGPTGSPCAQETTLGWILFGKVNDLQPDDDTLVMHHHVDIDLDNMLRNMWDIDQSTKRKLTADERRCEEVYAATQSRDPEDGRYIVTLPLKSDQTIQMIGETRHIALKRFEQLERRLDRNKTLKEEYTNVIEEYLELNHMEEVPYNEKKNPAVYLPHHAVVREDKETTKVRVVFNASEKGSNNKTLNDELLVGPQLQEDLRSIIMRWRIKPICFVADIQKMYRQILIKREDIDYQRILWRKNLFEDLREYRLLRVTFGTASAPYLAVRTLMQIAEDEGVQKGFHRAAQIIKEDFFVDDCMSGCMTEEEATNIRKELTEVLGRGGFELQKWASNSSEFMNQIQPSLRSSYANKEIKSERIMKTLGITWNMTNDCFQYNIDLSQPPKIITKRNILADLQRLFDPLGWLGAAIIPAKMLIQKLWVARLDWDEEVSETLKEEWLKWREGFADLTDIKVNRWLNIDREDTTKVTLHGFCDASTKAYCAVVYCRAETESGEIKTGIVASKTRVAPVKPISLPRLELLGAVLLAKLLTQVREAMRIPISQVHAWTDSAIVLSWLFGEPHRWKTFVSNRVVEILDNTCNTQWFHVASQENPADIGSRGIHLPQLADNKLWWEGPKWLTGKKMAFARPNVIPTDVERKRNIEVNLKIDQEVQENAIIFNTFESLQELLRTIVYCKRFINSKINPNNTDLPISTDELEDALRQCIKITQQKEYKNEIDRLKNNKNIKKSSSLKSLNPFLDNCNILRVGGRLRNSNLDEERKHPIILGTKNDLTPLLIADAHKRTLHGGIQLMLCYLRSRYWITRAKNAVKGFIHKCIICARQRALIRTQVMGDLPKVRTTPARPFLHSGVDFAGPLHVLMSKGRGAKSNKSYIAIFICMATKAIHLELVGDMTAESFIGAFHRFIARRGKCTHMWSDQGSNFTAANKELAAEWKEACLELPGHLADKLSSDGTQWHFIPPYSPNFGGLWEAGVKSVKFHLRRILQTSLTFEEMTTVLCQIEACLNSRPLIPIDTVDSDAAEPLTPGHFLIGEAPVTVPGSDLRALNLNRLSRWQLTQRLLRDFWHRWQHEYLSRLQERPKWLKREIELDIGDIVLLKDEQLPPGKWSMGRVVDKHPGSDGITRVYSIKYRNSIVKRSISKLCALPIDKS